MNWKLPISVKGIIFNHDHKVLLLRNDRDEWELPGGRLEKSEQPQETVLREINEELGITVEIEGIIDSWVYEVLQGQYVFIVTYLCKYSGDGNIRISVEHLEYDWFNINDIESATVSDGYKSSIFKAYKLKIYNFK